MAVPVLLPYLFLSRLGPIGEDAAPMLACLAAAFTVYWFGCVQERLRLSGTQVLILGLAMRVLLLPMPASDDMHRYLWEGKILALGFNPYVLAPDHPALAAWRDANWALVNHPSSTAVYPPLAMALFFLLAKMGGAVLLCKSAFVLFDVLGFLVLRKLAPSPGVQAVYFLNPLLVFEIAGQGHFDSLPVLLNIAFLWALSARKSWAPAALGLGASAKISSLALAPLLLFSPLKRAAAWGAALGALLAAVLWKVGALQSLGRFASDFRFNAAMPSLIDAALPFLGEPGRQGLSLILFAAAELACLWLLRAAAPERRALWCMGLLVLFSPTLHPWYLLWVLPFAALTRSRAWLLLTGTVFVTYAVYGRAHATGHWAEIPWLRLPEFLPPLFLFLFLQGKRIKAGTARAGL